MVANSCRKTCMSSKGVPDESTVVHPTTAREYKISVHNNRTIDSRCTRQMSHWSLANAKVGSWPASHCLDSTAGVGANDIEGVDMTRQASVHRSRWGLYRDMLCTRGPRIGSRVHSRAPIHTNSRSVTFFHYNRSNLRRCPPEGSNPCGFRPPHAMRLCQHEVVRVP